MKLFKKLSALGILLLFVGIGCSTPGSLASEEITDVAGIVIDGDSYDRVANAQVRLNGTDKSAVTNDNGIFTFRQVEVGDYTLTVESENYGSAEQEVSITDGGTRLEIKL